MFGKNNKKANNHLSDNCYDSTCEAQDQNNTPELYRDFTIKKSYYIKTSFKEHYNVFLNNGLSKFEALYNALYITMTDRTSSKARKIKKSYRNIGTNPGGWFANENKIKHLNLYDRIINVLESIPKCYHKLINKCTEFKKDRKRKLFDLSKGATIGIVTAACAVFAFTYIVNVNSYELKMMLYVDNIAVGTVENTELVNNVITSVENDISEQIAAVYNYDHDISFKPVFSKNETITSEQCYNTLYQICKDDLINAYMLYIDGVFVAANGNYEDLRSVISDFENYMEHTLSGYDSNVIGTKIINRIKIVNQLCEKSKLKSYEEIYSLLISGLGDMSIDMMSAVTDTAANTGSANVNMLALTGAEESAADTSLAPETNGSAARSDGVTETGLSEYQVPDAENTSPEYYQSSLDKIAENGLLNSSLLSESKNSETQGNETYESERVSVASIDSLLTGLSKVNENIEYGVTRNVQAANSEMAAESSKSVDIQLEFETTKTVTVTEPVPYETIYTDDATNYVGYELVTQDGTDGLREVTYSVSYVNNEEYSRTETDSKLITSATEQHVIRGTKPLPTTEPTGTLIWPRSGYITSEYGGRSLFDSYDFHLGIDISGRTGEAVCAADGGTVSYAAETASYGKMIIINHGNGMQTCYAHLSAFGVSVGDKVYQGQYIGDVGETGVATGPHLHFEVRVYGSTVDPMNYLK